MEFHEYFKAHPEIWVEFKKAAFIKINSGYKHYATQAIMEQARWNCELAFKPGDFYKINNNYSADYARYFMDRFPEHKGFFRIRKRTRKVKRATS